MSDPRDVTPSTRVCICGHLEGAHYEYVCNGRDTTRCHECDPGRDSRRLGQNIAISEDVARQYELADHAFVPLGIGAIARIDAEREARERLEGALREAMEWLARGYLALCREGWEPGMTETEASERINEVLDNYGWPMARRLALVPQETPEESRERRGGDVKTSEKWDYRVPIRFTDNGRAILRARNGGGYWVRLVDQSEVPGDDLDLFHVPQETPEESR